MEDPCLAIVEKDVDFYEMIEAPKFVDFTIPDSSRPDRMSWFCARIGCDQNHQQVDPNELNKSFMLRVMAARSPNVRFQRVLLNRQSSRANTKCPQSAPPKSIKNSRITDKITMAKIKQHPIASLIKTPIQKRIKEQTDTVVATKDKNFSHTPKKAKATGLEICSEKKNYAMSSNKCKKSSMSSTNHRNCNILKQSKHNEMRGIVSNGSDHVEKKNAIKAVKFNSGADNEIKGACNAINEDDKENTLFTFENKNLHPNTATSEVKRLQIENSNPQVNLYLNQVAKVQNKAFQTSKVTRTTNPKPFRLRTDERGILKESKKEQAMVLKNTDGIQIQETNSQAKLAKSNKTDMLNSKTMQGSHCKSLKIASTKKLLKITSVEKERKESISRILKEKRGLNKLAENRAVERRKAATIPKEPKFHKIHVPKNCIRRFEMAVS